MGAMSHRAYTRDIRRNVEAVLLHCIVPGFYGPRRRPTSSLKAVEAILATITEIRMWPKPASTAFCVTPILRTSTVRSQESLSILRSRFHLLYVAKQAGFLPILTLGWRVALADHNGKWKNPWPYRESNPLFLLYIFLNKIKLLFHHSM